MSAHTPEPWPDYGMVNRTPHDSLAQQLHDYARARACVNACAGIANFPERGLKAQLLDSAIARQEAITQRDELAAALRDLLDAVRQNNEGGTAPTADQIFAKAGRSAIAALAKVQP